MYWILFVALAAASLIFYAITRTDEFYNYDWSSHWTEYDKKARLGADCTPIVKIHRKLGQVSAWIWSVPKTCEQGLPHTRAIDVIALPVNMNDSNVSEILEHEKIHLLQRQMPDSWERFYKLSWDYDCYNEPPSSMPEELVTLKRANPDTADKPWCCWRGRWWSVPVYKSTINLSLAGAPVKWWDDTSRTILSLPPEQWKEFFGGDIHQLEHPHEISAELLAGPLLHGRLPPGAPDALLLIRDAWTDTSLFPSVDSE
jgi:hypothetical protein